MKCTVLPQPAWNKWSNNVPFGAESFLHLTFCTQERADHQEVLEDSWTDDPFQYLVAGGFYYSTSDVSSYSPVSLPCQTLCFVTGFGPQLQTQKGLFGMCCIWDVPQYSLLRPNDLLRSLCQSNGEWDSSADSGFLKLSTKTASDQKEEGETANNNKPQTLTKTVWLVG